jgi:trans-aconitate methyltransferase
MDNIQLWNSERYDNKLAFVSEYGKDVMQLLQPQHGERILDLGCGTGDLSYEIAKSGAVVTGMDLSSEMIAQAKVKYPQLLFEVGNGEQFEFTEKFDRIFSNAALHWMKNAESTISSIHCNLKLNGRFVAEFGGHGNVAAIVNAINEVLHEQRGITADERNPWYFPTIGQYSSLLEQHGFSVLYAQHFSRPTLMSDAEHGLSIWLDSFTDPFFYDFSSDEKKHAYSAIAQKTRSQLFYDGAWHLDYKRLRISAIKHREL